MHHLHGPWAPTQIAESAPPWAPSRVDLKSQGKISRLGEHPHSRWEFSQKNREQERMTHDAGESVFAETDPFSLFSGLLIYLLLHIETNENFKVTPPCVTLSKSGASYKCIQKGLRGFISSSGHEAC